MTRATSLSVWAFALLACAHSACTGTSTGNPIDPVEKPDSGMPDNTEDGVLTGTAAESQHCKADVKELAHGDTQNALGFSAEDVLDLVGAAHTIDMEWLNKGDVVVTPKATSKLHIEIAARDEKPRLVHLEEKGSGGSGVETALVPYACGDHLEVDVAVTVKTDDGGLDEQFDATLRADNLRMITLQHTIKADDLGGAATFTGKGSLKDFELTSLTFATSFSKLGIAGQLSPGFTSTGHEDGAGNASVSAGSGGNAARWPLGDACDQDNTLQPGQGVPVSLDQKFGDTSLQDAIDLVNAQNETGITWQGDERSNITLRFETDSDSGCASFQYDESDGSLGGLSDFPRLAVQGKLIAKSQDGRIDGAWPLKLTAYLAADDRLDHVITGNPSEDSYANLVSVDEFPSTYGIEGVDLDGYDQANAFVSISWKLMGSLLIPTGNLVVQGAHVPECAMPQPTPEPAPMMAPGGSSAPGGSAGCEGITLEDAAKASITRNPILPN